MRDSVKSLTKVKAYNIDCSSLNLQGSDLIVEGYWADQELTSLLRALCKSMLSTPNHCHVHIFKKSFQHYLLHHLLKTLRRVWLACSFPDPMSCYSWRQKWTLLSLSLQKPPLTDRQSHWSVIHLHHVPWTSTRSVCSNIPHPDSPSQRVGCHCSRLSHLVSDVLIPELKYHQYRPRQRIH